MTVRIIALDGDPALPDLEEQQVIEWAYAAPAGVWLRLLVDGLPLDPFLHPGDSTWRWRWNPGAAAGVHGLQLFLGEEQRHLTVRVLPRTIDRERYALLLDDLRATACDLVLMLGGAFEGAIPTPQLPALDSARPVLFAYYLLLEQRLDLFIRAVQQIALNPRDRLRAESAEIPFGQASSLDPSTPLLSFEPAPPTLVPNLQEAIRPGGGILPTHGQQRQSRPDSNTYEHRLLKRTINLLLRRVQRFAAVANHEAERLGTNRRVAEMQRMADGCAIADARLRELRSLPFLRDVAELDAFRGPTPLLQREAAYREVYRTWLALRREPLLATDTPLLRIPIAELPRLYELWCVLQVALVLVSAAGWQIDQQELIGEQEDGEPLLRIEPGDLLRIQQHEWTIVLRYQPRYRPLQSATDRHLGSLDRHTRVPDIALEAHGPNNALHVLIIDAKYRLDSDGRHVPQDALAEAYAYRGAIGRLGQTCVDAAWIVYPASTPAEHYLSQVGAIPLLPGSPNLLTERIAAWLANLGNP